MAQRFNITGFFILIGTFVSSANCFADSTYLAEFGKAEVAYSSWVSENVRQGKKLSADERRAMHQTLFADAHAAFITDQLEVQKNIIKMGKKFMHDLKNYNPPAKQGTVANIDGDALKQVAKSTPSRSLNNVASRTSNDAKASLDVKAGSADAVSFKAPAGGTPGTTGPTFKGSAGDVGGASAVSFSGGAPAPAATGIAARAPSSTAPKAAAATPGDQGGGSAVSFSAPAGTVDASPTGFNTPTPPASNSGAADATSSPAPAPANTRGGTSSKSTR